MYDRGTTLRRVIGGSNEAIVASFAACDEVVINRGRAAHVC